MYISFRDPNQPENNVKLKQKQKPIENLRWLIIFKLKKTCRRKKINVTLKFPLLKSGIVL